jgi:hypothetical protein
MRPPSILSPAIDLLLVGGLSLVVFVPLLLSGRSDLVVIGAGAQAWVATLINMPHFMASYRIVYRSRDMIQRHKWASIYVPAILVGYLLLAVAAGDNASIFVTLIVGVSSMYLAWHYTGQVWGMMASFAYLEGVQFAKDERFLIRTGLRILLAWHVIWFVHSVVRDPSRTRPLYLIISAGTLVAFVLGAIGLARLRSRTGKLPPTRALVAWLAIFVWYAVVARDPKAIFWIQIAHALQYLAFPIRVEINTTRTAERESRQRFATHMALYAVGLLALSYVVAQILPATAMSVVAEVFGETPANAAPILVLTMINIHHYFTDGVVWHISNPEVRKELFAHVPRPGREGAPTKGAGQASRASRRKSKR